MEKAGDLRVYAAALAAAFSLSTTDALAQARHYAPETGNPAKDIRAHYKAAQPNATRDPNQRNLEILRASALIDQNEGNVTDPTAIQVFDDIQLGAGRFYETHKDYGRAADLFLQAASYDGDKQETSLEALLRLGSKIDLAREVQNNPKSPIFINHLLGEVATEYANMIYTRAHHSVNPDDEESGLISDLNPGTDVRLKFLDRLGAQVTEGIINLQVQLHADVYCPTNGSPYYTPFKTEVKGELRHATGTYRRVLQSILDYTKPEVPAQPQPFQKPQRELDKDKPLKMQGPALYSQKPMSRVPNTI